MEGTSLLPGINPVISVQTPSGGSRLVRTSSGDSVTTEVSVTSCMEGPSSSPRLAVVPQSAVSLQSGLRVSFRPGRGPSPVPGDRLSVPHHSTTRPCSATSSKGAKDIWLDEENDLIRSCGALSKALGLQKSFSTSDILSGGGQEGLGCGRHTRSELFLLECGTAALGWGRLEANSRSLSTWVAVGDVQSSTSQLPSPQVELCKGFPEVDCGGTHFTAADFIRSVNKKVRQNYIRRRLKVTYKALEQFSESDFDLDRLEETVKKTRQSRNLESVMSVTPDQSRTTSSLGHTQPLHCPARALETAVKDLGISGIQEVKSKVCSGSVGGTLVSQKEIERDRGKPLSKYQRNIMIFDWLHTLDETATAAVEMVEKEMDKDKEQEKEKK